MSAWIDEHLRIDVAGEAASVDLGSPVKALNPQDYSEMERPRPRDTAYVKSLLRFVQTFLRVEAFWV